MKRILFGSGFMLCVICGFGQNSPGAPSKSLTVEEANRLNGVAQPTINGKPYSQYKAEQDALKKQMEANKIAAAQNRNLDVVTVNPSDARPAPAKVEPAEKKSENDNNIKPVQGKADASITKTATKETTPKPEVPEQFKLPATTPAWDGSAVADKQVVNRSAPTPVQLKSNPAQPLDGSIPVEASKTKQTVEKVEFRQGAGTTTPQDVKPVTQKTNATTPVAPPVIKAETEKTPSGNNSTGAQTKTD